MIEMEEQTDVTQEEAEAWIKEHYQRPDDNTALREAVEEKCAKLDVPGLVVEFQRRSRCAERSSRMLWVRSTP